MIKKYNEFIDKINEEWMPYAPYFYNEGNGWKKLQKNMNRNDYL
jgi:hypothetical protein